VITAIAIDDEPLALEIIQAYCADVEGMNLVKTFTQTSEAKKHLDKFPVDLIFLDVNMPSISGIDFYKGIDQDTMVIFTTAHSQYAVEGFELSAVDFLLKPYSFERFHIAVNKAKDYHEFLHHKQSEQTKHLFIRSEFSLIKLLINDILYVEGLADYLKIHQITGKTLLTRMTMKNILSKLPSNDFIRVHRSFIIPLSRIKSVRNKVIQLEQEKEIPIGVSYEEEFNNAFGKR
jgi:DNA-binding LytR/AlgR family response regulator